MQLDGNFHLLMERRSLLIDTIFVGESCSQMRESALSLTKCLAQTAQRTFSDFEEAVEKDATKNIHIDGTVHPLMSYVINYVKFYLIRDQDPFNIPAFRMHSMHRYTNILTMEFFEKANKLALKASQLLEPTKLGELRMSIARSLSELEMFTELGEQSSTARRKMAIDERIMVETYIHRFYQISQFLNYTTMVFGTTAILKFMSANSQSFFQPYLVKRSIRMQWRRHVLIALWEFSEENIKQRIEQDMMALKPQVEDPNEKNNTDYRENKIHTGWLYSRISMHARAQRPPWYLSVVEGGLCEASSRSSSVFTDYVGYLSKGQIQPKEASTSRTSTVFTDYVRYLSKGQIPPKIDVVRRGLGSYTFSMNGSKIEAEIHSLRDANQKPKIYWGVTGFKGIEELCSKMQINIEGLLGQRFDFIRVSGQVGSEGGIAVELQEPQSRRDLGLSMFYLRRFTKKQCGWSVPVFQIKSCVSR
uniref:Exocyst subunit Exo70 family protein n=1 Tax=Oryza brachyantha TaxID=4533 RepID=J3NCT7_ORYBR